MDIEFKEPWIAVGEFASSLAQELQLEATAGHPLWSMKVLAWLGALIRMTLYLLLNATGNPRNLPWST